SESGGSMSMSASSSALGSSSTTRARLVISRRNWVGMSRTASATRRSKAARVMVVGAIVAHATLLAERLGFAHPPSVENLDVRGERPFAGRQPRAELLLDGHRVVALGDADTVGHAKDVPIDRQPGYAERMAEHDIGCLASYAGQRGERIHVRRHL